MGRLQQFAHTLCKVSLLTRSSLTLFLLCPASVWLPKSSHRMSRMMFQKQTQPMEKMKSPLEPRSMTLQKTVRLWITHKMKQRLRSRWTVGPRVGWMNLRSQGAKVIRLKHTVLMGRNPRGPVHPALTLLKQPASLHTLPIQNSSSLSTIVPGRLWVRPVT